MKTTTALLAVALLSATSATAQEAAATDWVDRYDTLVQKYVTKKGVEYEAWHGDAADRKALADVVAAIGVESVGGKSKDEKLAFYLNAYNAWILHRILDEYPTDRPGGGGLIGRNKFFKGKDIKVAGETTSFHSLENDVIRPFDEPRIHFALNCASASCPPLNAKAFRAQTLDATLDALTKSFVNSNPSGVGRASRGKVAISKIFDWYGEDFESAGGPLAYINQYRTQKLPKSTKVSFQSYSWSLNEAR